MGARIIAVADAFDAITTDRHYQKAKTYDEALLILKHGAGTKWDSECVVTFKRALPSAMTAIGQKPALVATAD